MRRKTVHEDRIRRGMGEERVIHLTAGAGADAEQRVASVIAIANVSNFQAAQISEALLEREEVGERLAGMIEIGKRVDHRNSGVSGELVERFLFEDASDNASDPAFQAFGDVRNGFALAQMRHGVIEKYG